MIQKKRFFLNFIAGLLVLILLTVIISFLKLDIKFEEFFFDSETQNWSQRDFTAWDWAYHYGPYPAIILSIFSLVLLILSIFIPKCVSIHRYCYFIILSLALGPGLLVNGIFKDRWGRPRPRQVEQFGGIWEFREAWEPGIPGRGKSFPSGHSSMGFFLIVIYFIYKRKNRFIAHSGLLASVAMGFYIGTARMAQGGHFLSDVLWAGGMTYGAAAILAYYLLKIPDRTISIKKQRTKKPLLKWSLVISIIGLIIYIFLFSKPVYEEYFHELNPLGEETPIHFVLQMDKGHATFFPGRFESPIEIKTILHGYGWPNHHLKSQLLTNGNNDTLQAIYDLDIQGIFQKMKVETGVYFDSSYAITVSKANNKGAFKLKGSMPTTLFFK